VTFFYPSNASIVIPGGTVTDPKALRYIGCCTYCFVRAMRAPQCYVYLYLYVLYSLERDLLIWGLLGMQEADSDDPWSFFQIAGIHGLPYQAYDGDDSTGWKKAWKERKADGWWGGYCHHGDALFPSWHRPYILLFERAVIHFAVRKVEDVVAPSDKTYNDLIKAAEDVRLPYLDWAGTYIKVNGLPNIFSDPTVFSFIIMRCCESHLALGDCTMARSNNLVQSAEVLHDASRSG